MFEMRKKDVVESLMSLSFSVAVFLLGLPFATMGWVAIYGIWFGKKTASPDIEIGNEFVLEYLVFLPLTIILTLGGFVLTGIWIYLVIAGLVNAMGLFKDRDK